MTIRWKSIILGAYHASVLSQDVDGLLVAEVLVDDKVSARVVEGLVVKIARFLGVAMRQFRKSALHVGEGQLVEMHNEGVDRLLHQRPEDLVGLHGANRPHEALGRFRVKLLIRHQRVHDPLDRLSRQLVLRGEIQALGE